jgi:hypothetical protein
MGRSRTLDQDTAESFWSCVPPPVANEQGNIAVVEFARIQSVAASLKSGEFRDCPDCQDFLPHPGGHIAVLDIPRTQPDC